MKPLVTLLLIITSAYAIAQDNYKEITLPDLAEKVNSKKDIVVVDVRSPGEYYDTTSAFQSANIGRIKGSIHLNVQDMTKDKEVLHKLDQYKNSEVYVICSHSYRSRNASNILIENGFTNVTNVKGGMSDWFRNYDILKKYYGIRETSAPYKNVSPSELYSALSNNKNVLIQIVPKGKMTFYDSVISNTLPFYPAAKNVKNFAMSDSMQILHYVQQSGKPVYIWNASPQGANAAWWLTSKGIPDVHYVVGGLEGLYDYVKNNKSEKAFEKTFSRSSEINFETPVSACDLLNSSWKKVVVIDMRPDSLFNKNNKGTKLTYKHLKNAVNIPLADFQKTFEKSFPDKSKYYLLVPPANYKGIEIADVLSKKGYRIHWLTGGNERWEWYVNNYIDFKCNNHFE